MKQFISFLIFIASLYSGVHADDLKKVQFSNCVLSPVIKLTHIPENPLPYNDLTKGDAGLDSEYIDKILLRGIVLDKKCVPISNAKILLWQKDEYGDYRYNVELSTNEDHHKLNDKSYRNFKGNGTAISDNNGQFTFVTVMPATDDHSLALVNMAVQTKDSGSLTTQLLLLDENKEKKPIKAVEVMFNEEASDFYGQEVYDFFLVIDGLNKHRQY